MGSVIQISNVAELIAALQQMPPEAKVRYAWDGELRSTARFVWLSKIGDVGLCADISDLTTDGGIEEENRPAIPVNPADYS